MQLQGMDRVGCGCEGGQRVVCLAQMIYAVLLFFYIVRPGPDEKRRSVFHQKCRSKQQAGDQIVGFERHERDMLSRHTKSSRSFSGMTAKRPNPRHSENGFGNLKADLRHEVSNQSAIISSAAKASSGR